MAAVLTPTPPAFAGTWLQRQLARATRPILVLLSLSLFTLALYESWKALRHAAEVAQIADPHPWPWMVDGFIVMMALLIVHASQLGVSDPLSVWGPRVGLLAATALSTGIQMYWAPHQDWAWALHGWSPLAVLFSFECLIRLLWGNTLLPAAQARNPGSAQDAAGVAGVRAAADPTSEGRRPATHQEDPGTVHPATPPRTPAPVTATAEPGDSRLPDTPRAGEPRSRPRGVAGGPDFGDDVKQALRRQKANPAGFDRIVEARGLDREEALAWAAANGWAVANGLREAVGS